MKKYIEPKVYLEQVETATMMAVSFENKTPDVDDEQNNFVKEDVMNDAWEMDW